MNFIFHLASAIGTVLLVLWLLNLQRQRDLLRALTRAAVPGGRRVVVESPLSFLTRLSHALGIPIEVEGSAQTPPTRIDLGPVAELFSRAAVTLIRWKASSQPHVELVLATPVKDLGALAPALTAALGGVQVQVLEGAKTL